MVVTSIAILTKGWVSFLCRQAHNPRAPSTGTCELHRGGEAESKGIKYDAIKGTIPTDEAPIEMLILIHSFLHFSWRLQTTHSLFSTFVFFSPT